MPIYVPGLLAIAVLGVWIAIHHTWIRWRRPDLRGHGSFALLALGAAGVGFAEWLMQQHGDLDLVRLGDRLDWPALVGAATALVWFAHRMTGICSWRWPAAFSMGFAASLGLWLAKPFGFMDAPIGGVRLRTTVWGEIYCQPVFHYDWSYAVVLAVTASAFLWCFACSLVAWRRTHVGRHLAMAVAMALVGLSVVNSVFADLFRIDTISLLPHGIVAFGLLMSAALTAELARAAELERRLRQAEHFEALGRLAGGVAHDFGNVLAAITGAADLLNAAGTKDAESAELVALIRSASDRGTGLTRQLMAFAAGAKAPPGRIDVHIAIQEVAALVGSRRIRVQLDLQAPHHHVLGDPARLTSLLLNLAVNARDAMPGGGTLAIATSDRGPQAGAALRLPLVGDDHVAITVSDTGKGIPAEQLERIWEPLFTTKGASGTGLGMQQIEEALRSLGGTVQVESEPGRGTTFRIWLPRHRGSSHHRPATLAGERPVLVAGATHAVSQLQAAALAGHCPWPVTPAHADESGIHLAAAVVVEAAVAASCRRNAPDLPLVVLGQPEVILTGPHAILPAEAPPAEVAAALHRLLGIQAGKVR